MNSQDMSSIFLSVFKRKGAEGLYTKIINDTNRDQYPDLISKLDKEEKALLACYKNTLDWFLLSNNRILMSSDGICSTLNNSDIIEVRPALEEELEDRIMNKNDFTRLKLKTKDGKYTILKLEKGQAYEGIYQVLHFIKNGNLR